MEYLIRECIIADLPALVELCRQHALYERANYESDGKLVKLEDAMFSTQPKLYCLVIESNGKLVGYTSYTFDFSTWDAQTFLYMDCLYFDDNFRGLGAGKAVMRKLIEIARDRQCINIQWQTPEWNVRAIKFYHDIGGGSKDKVRFTLPLSGELMPNGRLI